MHVRATFCLSTLSLKFRLEAKSFCEMREGIPEVCQGSAFALLEQTRLLPDTKPIKRQTKTVELVSIPFHM